jgi:hypothetical protein
VRAWAAFCALGATLLLVAPADARTLRWARSIDATTLDPHAANTGPNLLLGHQIYEPLIVRQFDGKMLPALAVSWALTRDPTVWEFKIRPNVKFHDGASLDADDVVFSLDRARAPKSDMKSLLSSVEMVTRADPLTVRIKTRGPDPLLPNNLTDVLILDRGWAEAHRVAEPQDLSAGEDSAAATRANGTGAYTLVSREAGEKTGHAAQRGLLGPRRGPARNQRDRLPADPRQRGPNQRPDGRRRSTSCRTCQSPRSRRCTRRAISASIRARRIARSFSAWMSAQRSCALPAKEGETPSPTRGSGRRST